MNRRNLLRLLGLAPIAIPSIAAAAPTGTASSVSVGRMAKPFLIGEVPGESVLPGRIAARQLTASKIRANAIRCSEIAEAPVTLDCLTFARPSRRPSPGFFDGDGI